MNQTIFIGDVHLDKRYPDTVSAFVNYLSQLSDESVDALYILGDLFEYWLGDDCVDRTANHVAKALTHYHQQSQTPIYFIHGNRDFLLAEDFAKRCAMQLLPEYHVINLYGIKTLLLHGDTLCTDDASYMTFRQRVRTPEWQQKVLNLPAWMRRLKAKHMRYQSQKANAKKDDQIMDVAHESVIKTMQDFGVTQIIHGHTHRPAIHTFAVTIAGQQQTAHRYVVGDWYEQGSVLTVSPQKTELITLPLT